MKLLVWLLFQAKSYAASNTYANLDHCITPAQCKTSCYQSLLCHTTKLFKDGSALNESNFLKERVWCSSPSILHSSYYQNDGSCMQPLYSFPDQKPCTLLSSLLNPRAKVSNISPSKSEKASHPFHSTLNFPLPSFTSAHAKTYISLSPATTAALSIVSLLTNSSSAWMLWSPFILLSQSCNYPSHFPQVPLPFTAAHSVSKTSNFSSFFFSFSLVILSQHLFHQACFWF